MGLSARPVTNLHVVDVGSVDAEIRGLLAQEAAIRDFDNLEMLDATIGCTDMFLELPGTDAAPLLVESRVAVPRAPIPDEFVRDGMGLLVPAGIAVETRARPSAKPTAVDPNPERLSLNPRQRWIERLTSPAAVIALFGAIVVAIVMARYGVLVSGNAPPTIDAGNWLSFAESLLGNSPRDTSITYPPAVPLLAELFSSIFGVSRGISALGAISSAVPAIGLFVALRMVGVGRLRIVPALLLLGAGSIGEATAWGGFPQLLGMGILPIAVVVGVRFVEKPSRDTALDLAAGLMALLATSHFVSSIFIMSVLVAGTIELLSNRKPAKLLLYLKYSPWVLLPSIVLSGIYFKLVSAVILNPNEFASLDNLTWGTALRRLHNIYAEFPALWQILVPLAVLTPVLTWPVRRSAVWRLSTSLTLAVTALLALTQEGRYLYFVPLAALVSLGVWIAEMRPGPSGVNIERPVAITYGFLAVGIVAAIAMQMSAGLTRFDEQREFYAVLRPGLVEAIHAADDVVEANRGGPGAIAIPSLNNAPVGWWVEALTDETVVYGSPLRWLNFGDEIERAKVANAVFHPAFPDEDSLGLLETAGVRVLLMPREWSWYDDETVDRWIEENNLRVLERNRDALAIDLG